MKGPKERDQEDPAITNAVEWDWLLSLSLAERICESEPRMSAEALSSQPTG